MRIINQLTEGPKVGIPAGLQVFVTSAKTTDIRYDFTETFRRRKQMGREKMDFAGYVEETAPENYPDMGAITYVGVMKNGMQLESTAKDFGQPVGFAQPGWAPPAALGPANQ